MCMQFLKHVREIENKSTFYKVHACFIETSVPYKNKTQQFIKHTFNLENRRVSYKTCARNRQCMCV